MENSVLSIYGGHYTPPDEVGGGVYWNHLVRLSVCLSVRPSVGDMVSGA